MMAEHTGERIEEEEDPFADLLPEARKSERTTRILALAAFIASAKDRGNSWANICRRLEEKKGISVSPDHLRMTMERYADYKAKPRKRAKPNTKDAGKQNKTSAIKSNARTPAKAHTQAGAEAGDASRRRTNTVTTAEPASGPSLETTPKSKFLKMEPTL